MLLFGGRSGLSTLGTCAYGLVALPIGSDSSAIDKVDSKSNVRFMGSGLRPNMSVVV